MNALSAAFLTAGLADQSDLSRVERELEEERVAKERPERESRTRDILQRDPNLPALLKIQEEIDALIKERNRLLEEAGYEVMSYGSYGESHHWWGRPDLDFIRMGDHCPPGSSFPTYW
jgi:hypothetical protein